MRLIVNIDVPDLGPAIDFYRSALGLTLSRFLGNDVAEVVGASSVLYLLRKDAGSNPTESAATVRHYDRHWTPVHMDFVVDDLDNAAQRAISAGARQESECVESMGSKWITFSDPFGHGFCLIQFAGDTYDENAA